MPDPRPLAGALGLVAAAALPIFLSGSLAIELRREFAFGDVVLGVAVGISFATATIASAPAGRLVAGMTTGAAVRLTVALAIACSLGIALLAHSALTVIALLIIGGLGNAVSSPAASAVLTRDVALERHGIGYGALTAGAPIGALLAGLALPVIAQPMDWRIAFVAAALLALLAGLTAEVGSGGDRCTMPTRAAAPFPEAGRRWNRVHLLAVTSALASAASTGLITFLVVFSVDSGMSGGDAGVLLAGTGLAAAVSRIGLGIIADRAAGWAPRLLVVLLVSASGGFLLLLTEVPALIVVGAFLAGGLGWGWSGLITLIAVREGVYDAAEAVGIVMSGLFLGALTGPILIGLIVSNGGFVFAWLLAAGLALAAAALAVAQTAPRLDRQGPPL